MLSPVIASEDNRKTTVLSLSKLIAYAGTDLLVGVLSPI